LELAADLLGKLNDGGCSRIVGVAEIADVDVIGVVLAADVVEDVGAADEPL